MLLPKVIKKKLEKSPEIIKPFFLASIVLLSINIFLHYVDVRTLYDENINNYSQPKTVTQTKSSPPVPPSPLPSPDMYPPASPDPTVPPKKIVPRSNTISGYFTQYKGNAWGETKECNALIVLSNTELTNEYIENIEQGNGVNRLTPDGKLILNLDFEKIPKTNGEKIIVSTENNPVSLTIEEKIVTADFGAPVCYSFVDVVDVL